MDSGWLKALEVPGHRVLLLGLAALLVAIAAEYGILGLDELPKWIRLALAAGGLLLTILGLGWGVAAASKWLWRLVRAPRARQAKQERVMSHLEALTREEVDLLFPMLVEGRRYFMSEAGYGRPPWISSLHHRGLLQVKTYGGDAVQWEVTEPLWSMRIEMMDDLKTVMDHLSKRAG